MTRRDAVNLVMLRLGKRTGLETDVVLEMQQAQRDLEAGPFLPWFLAKALSISVQANVRTSDLPSGFLREAEHRLWLTTEGTAREMTKGTYDELYRRELFSAESISSPYYAIVGKTLYNFPMPSAPGTIDGFYYASDAVLSTDDTENQWLTYASSVLISRAGMRMAKTLRDDSAYALFQGDYAAAYRDMVTADTARAEAGMIRVAGG